MNDSPRESLSSDWRRTFWAVADQCAVSGGNFVTNLILLRILLPVEYGTYALILNAMIFCNGVQHAFIAYPLFVRGARARHSQFQRLVAFALLGTTLLLLTLLGPGLTVVALSLHLSAAICAALLTICFWQLQDTLRAGFIAQANQKRALPGDAISYVGQALVLGLLCLQARPSLGMIFWTMAGTSFLGFLVQVMQLRPRLSRRRAFRPLIREFWMLGRWNVVAMLLSFFTLQAFPWLILLGHGRADVAAFQALMQLLAFSNPLLFSLGSLITSTVARTGDFRGSTVRRYLLFTFAIMGSYILLLLAVGPYLMRLLYGSLSQYLVYAPFMRIFAAAWAFEVIALVATAILGGLRRPRSIFIAQLFGTIAAVSIALPATYWEGIIAAGFGLLLVNVVRAGAGVLLIARHRSRMQPAVRDGYMSIAQAAPPASRS